MKWRAVIDILQHMEHIVFYLKAEVIEAATLSLSKVQHLALHLFHAVWQQSSRCSDFLSWPHAVKKNACSQQIWCEVRRNYYRRKIPSMYLPLSPWSHWIWSMLCYWFSHKSENTHIAHGQGLGRGEKQALTVNTPHSYLSSVVASHTHTHNMVLTQ